LDKEEEGREGGDPAKPTKLIVADSLIDLHGDLDAKYKEERAREKAGEEQKERTLKSVFKKERNGFLNAGAAAGVGGSGSGTVANSSVLQSEPQPMHTTALLALSAPSSSAAAAEVGSASVPVASPTPTSTAVAEESGARHAVWIQPSGQEDPVRITRPITEKDRAKKVEHVNEVQFGAMDLSVGMGGAVA
jgi:hypothetical protein